MLKKFFAFFYTDVLWKLLALGLSVLLWLVSMTVFDPEENSSHAQTLDLDNITILENENVVLLNEQELLAMNILVGVRAAISLMNNPLNIAEIRPSIDLRAVIGREVHEAEGITEWVLPVGVNLPEGFDRLHIYPSEVVAILDARIRQPFPIDILTVGTVGAGAELHRLWSANQSVTLTGPRSIINRVAKVQVYAELQNATENFSRLERLVVYDLYGHELNEYLTLNVSETTLHAEIWQVKRVPIDPEIIGTLAPGFAVAEIGAEPGEIYIVGPAYRLEGIDGLRPGFDLEQASEDFNRVIDITDYLPDGVSLAQGETAGVFIEVTVEPIREQSFTISRGNIGVFGYASHSVLNNPTHVTVRVSGPASHIAMLTPANITVQLNLHNLPIGIHHVPLRVILPPGLRLVGNPPALDVQIYEPAGPGAPEDDPTPPAEPDPPDPPVTSDPPDETDPDELPGGESDNGGDDQDPPEED